MRKQVLGSIILLPLLLGFAYAGQNWSVDPPIVTWGFSSDDSGTGSYLGVDIADVTSERVSALKLKEEKGVEVTMVDQDAPAGKAGIKIHDVILSMNGTSIESGAQIKRMIHETRPGRLVTLDISRDGQPLTVKIQLADRQKQYVWSHNSKDMPEIMAIPNLPDFDMPNINVVVVHNSARSGLMVENITPQLGEFFGVKGGKGVLVRSVEKGSRAEKAGLRAGDVIVKVNDQAVHDTSDFTEALRSRTGGSVSVGVMRDRKEQNLNLTLPLRKDSGEMKEESLDDDDFSSETHIDLSEMTQNLAKLEPQLKVAMENLSKASQQMRKSLCTQSKQWREQADKWRKEFQPQIREKIMQQMDSLHHQLQGDDLLEL